MKNKSDSEKKRRKDRGDSVRPNSEKKTARIRGTIAARKCKYCGHHEIGLITEGGRYLSLNPGMKVEIIRNNRMRGSAHL